VVAIRGVFAGLSSDPAGMDFLESVVRMAGIDEEQQLPLVEVEDPLPENPSQGAAAGATESDVAFYTAPFEPAAAELVSDDCDEESAAIMATKASADGGNTVDLIHSVVKMAVDDDDGSSSSISLAARRRARSESGCTDDEDTSAAAVVEAARQAQEDPPKSYFNELFPRLDLDGEAWLRAWPKFTTGARQQLCHDDSGCHRATYEQYEFNLKMYEWDAWSGNYRNRDLRRQDEIQRKLETDPSLYDQKMYMDYYGRRDASGGHGFSSPWDRNNTLFPPPTMDHPTQWNGGGGARVKHGADINMSSLYEQHVSSFGPDRSRLNVPQPKMAANMTKSGAGVNLKSRRDVYSTSGTRFRPLPPSPMVVPPQQQQQQQLRCYNYNN